MKIATFDELTEYISKLSYADMVKLTRAYADITGSSLEKELVALSEGSIDRHMVAAGINSRCPKCGSSILVKHGKRNGLQMYACTECGTRFNRLRGTIFEKTHYHWDVWIQMLEYLVDNVPLKVCRDKLVDKYNLNGLTIETVWVWRMKLMHAVAAIKPPQLKGVVQIDETFFREGQKSSKHLINHLDKSEPREPRYGRKPSELGIMGPEFATVVTAVDETGHAAAFITGLGKLTPEIFTTLFDEYISTSSFICTDMNKVYRPYCKIRKIPHYEKPSNYDSVVAQSGILAIHPFMSDYEKSKIKEANHKIMRRLYNEDRIDHIVGYEDRYTYEQFLEIKKKRALGLSRVNQFHSTLKLTLEKMTYGVSSVHLADYIGFQVFLKNWRADHHGSEPAKKSDYEEILIAALKTGENITKHDLKHRQLKVPVASPQAVKALADATSVARIVNSDSKFKLRYEDGFTSLQKREYLEALPRQMLLDILSKTSIKGFSKKRKTQIAQRLMAEKNISQLIMETVYKNRAINERIDEEDKK